MIPQSIAPTCEKAAEETRRDLVSGFRWIHYSAALAKPWRDRKRGALEPYRIHALIHLVTA